jgi:hypothetical protein
MAMFASAQTPWHSAPLRRRRFGPMTVRLAQRVLEQARGRQEIAIERVRKAMAKRER